MKDYEKAYKFWKSINLYTLLSVFGIGILLYMLGLVNFLEGIGISYLFINCVFGLTALIGRMFFKEDD